jgi:Met-10+ like-protein
MGRRSFWAQIVGPYFAWHAHKFRVSTAFGSQIAGDTRDIVQQYIYYFGVWEPNLTRWIVRRLAPGDVFIDVDTNVGYYSLLASKLVGESGSVVAIEASPSTFKILQTNLALNHVRDVRAVNMAAYDSTTIKKVFRGSEYDGPAGDHQERLAARPLGDEDVHVRRKIVRRPSLPRVPAGNRARREGSVTDDIGRERALCVAH